MKLCFKGSSKYAIAERLGNYINPESDILEKLPSIDEQDLFICAKSLLMPIDNDNWYDYPCRYSSKEECKVIFSSASNLLVKNCSI